MKKEKKITHYMTEEAIPHYICDYCAYPIYNNIDELWHSRECKGNKYANT